MSLVLNLLYDTKLLLQQERQWLFLSREDSACTSHERLNLFACEFILSVHTVAGFSELFNYEYSDFAVICPVPQDGLEVRPTETQEGVWVPSADWQVYFSCGLVAAGVAGYYTCACRDLLSALEQN